jgi:hypothetical protein
MKGQDVEGGEKESPPPLRAKVREGGRCKPARPLPPTPPRKGRERI